MSSGLLWQEARRSSEHPVSPSLLLVNAKLHALVGLKLANSDYFYILNHSQSKFVSAENIK